jgi:hypothetical protein
MAAEETTATPKTIKAFGTYEKETTNQVRYTTSWGVIYIPKAQAAKLTADGSYPENIKFTVEVQEG